MRTSTSVDFADLEQAIIAFTGVLIYGISSKALSPTLDWFETMRLHEDVELKDNLSQV